MAAPIRIAAGTGRATTLGAGQRLVIRNVEGRQVADFVAFNMADLTETFSIRVPLRAWVVVDPAVPLGQVPADELARHVLGVVPGASLEIRSI